MWDSNEERKKGRHERFVDTQKIREEMCRLKIGNIEQAENNPEMDGEKKC